MYMSMNVFLSFIIGLLRQTGRYAELNTHSSSCTHILGQSKSDAGRIDASCVFISLARYFKAVDSGEKVCSDLFKSCQNSLTQAQPNIRADISYRFNRTARRDFSFLKPGQMKAWTPEWQYISYPDEHQMLQRDSSVYLPHLLITSS